MKRSIPIILLLLFFISVLSCKKENVIDLSKYKGAPHNLISLEKSKILYLNYNNNIKPIIEDYQNQGKANRDYNSTEYIWISMDNLKHYIAFLQQLEQKNKNQPKISGISIYMGAYSRDKSVLDENLSINPKRFGDYRSRETVFLTPTYFDESKSNNRRIMNHIPFHIRPTGKDPFFGTYIQTDYSGSLKNNHIGGSQDGDDDSGSDGDTGLGMNELNTVPPRTSM